MYSERGKSTSHAASETSFYTTEEKMDYYPSLPEVLGERCANPLVRQVVQDLMAVCADITEALRAAIVTVEGTSNEFGDSQLSVDVSAPALFPCPCPFKRDECAVTHKL